MQKTIINEDMLPEKLYNYVGKLHIWNDAKNRKEYYHFVNTIHSKTKQKTPKKTILSYDGSGKKKGVPNGVMFSVMRASSEPIGIEILCVNSVTPGFFEQKYTALHNWPDGGII